MNHPAYSRSESSKINNSSIAVSRTLASRQASFREGFYFPFSRKTIVSLLTPIIFFKMKVLSGTQREYMGSSLG